MEILHSKYSIEPIIKKINVSTMFDAKLPPS